MSEWIISDTDLGCDGAHFSYTEIVRCKECKHFMLDYWEKINGKPLIVAHMICTAWGGGCKTSQDGYCFMGERRTDDIQTKTQNRHMVINNL